VNLIMNKIIFLGTGSASHLTRQMTAILFLIDGRGILMDCGDGMGTVRNIVKSGVPLSIVNDVFVTHRHADHIAGMPHYLFVKMVEDKEARVRVFGPRQALVAVKTISFLTHDLTRVNHYRIAFVPMSPRSIIKLVPGLFVTCAKFKPGNEKSAQGYAYAINFNNKKITFTSDTQPCRSVAKFAVGSDILIHECFGTNKNADWIHSVGHSTARDAGELARESGAKHLILTHLPKETTIKPETLLNEAGRYFKGKITLAFDLMEMGI
jgi:ribonuclease Z